MIILFYAFILSIWSIWGLLPSYRGTPSIWFVYRAQSLYSSCTYLCIALLLFAVHLFMHAVCRFIACIDLLLFLVRHFIGRGHGRVTAIHWFDRFMARIILIEIGLGHAFFSIHLPRKVNLIFVFRNHLLSIGVSSHAFSANLVSLLLFISLLYFEFSPNPTPVNEYLHAKCLFLSFFYLTLFLLPIFEFVVLQFIN